MIATISAIAVTIPCTATKSRLIRYCVSVYPIPCHSKVVSVSTAPASNAAICNPMTVTTGISALRNACARMTRRSGTPRARAAST